MISRNPIKRILRLLQTVRYRVLQIQSRIPRIQQRYYLNQHALQRPRWHPPRRSQTLHAYRPADRHVTRPEREPRLNHADKEGVQGVVLGEYHLVL